MLTDQQQGNHIRRPVGTSTMDLVRAVMEQSFCGQQGGSISYHHYQTNPVDHVQSLPMCEDCMRPAGEKP